MLLAASSSQSWERDALFRRSPSSQGLWDRREAGGGDGGPAFRGFHRPGEGGRSAPTDPQIWRKTQKKKLSWVFLPSLPRGERGRGSEGRRRGDAERKGNGGIGDGALVETNPHPSTSNSPEVPSCARSSP